MSQADDLRRRRPNQPQSTQPVSPEGHSNQLKDKQRTLLVAFKVVLPILAIGAAILATKSKNNTPAVAKPAMRADPRVVVIGGGLAGLSATIEALVSGARVTLIDKARLGGNSAKATSGINAVLTDHQIRSIKGVESSNAIATFVQEILKSGQGSADRNLAHILSAYSADAVGFLQGKLKPDQQLSHVVILGGHGMARTHRMQPLPPGAKPLPLGFTVISALKEFLLSERWKNNLEVSCAMWFASCQCGFAKRCSCINGAVSISLSCEVQVWGCLWG